MRRSGDQRIVVVIILVTGIDVSHLTTTLTVLTYARRYSEFDRQLKGVDSWKITRTESRDPSHETRSPRNSVTPQTG